MISKASDPVFSMLYQRWKWLSYRTYPILAHGILEAQSQSLDDAIKKAWSAYQVGYGWQAVSEQADYWLVSHTVSQGEGGALQVHFNLLTGEILVSGLPLARLPPKYGGHPIYRTLFGHSALEVMPTPVHGMQFSGKKEYAGYTLHFGTKPIPGTRNSPGYDLLVRAVKDDQKYELVTSSVFRGELPVAFVEEFVHWYDTTNDCLELRPIQSPWASSPHNWRLIRAKAGTRWLLVKSGLSLVSPKSETARALSRILCPLEDPLRIHIALHHSSSSLELDLPRLQLGFYLKSGESSIRSRQFRGMAIDISQSLDTLVGLRNKLMLKHEINGSRLLLLADGCISYEWDGDHVLVIIDKGSAAKTHPYHIDEHIGRLVDNGSLQSKLLLCYLHALTSFCLPDPLTQRTGTEQALSILNSAAVRSFDHLTPECIELLRQISHLTPGRSYYPANERVMQTVEWAPQLGFLAQHGQFYKSVNLIFDQAEKTKMFYPETYIQPPTLNHVEPDLLERDCVRSSTYRVSGFGAEDHTVEHDVIYSARDRNQDSVRGSQAFVVSSIVYQGCTTVHYDVPSNLRTRLWDLLSRSSQIFGPSHPVPLPEIKYNAQLLQDPGRIIAERWCAFHRTFSQPNLSLNRFNLMIWLSTLAFAEDIDITIIQALTSFYVMPEMAQIFPPAITSFCLSRGAAVKSSELRGTIRPALLQFHRCPEARSSHRVGESQYAFQQRRQRLFQSNQDCAVNKVIGALEAQWPCEIPFAPVNVDSHLYMDMIKVMQNTESKFKSWYDNYQLNLYLRQIDDALQHRVVRPVEMPSTSFALPTWKMQKTHSFISIDDVFTCSPPSMSACATGNLTSLLSLSPAEDKPFQRLTSLITTLGDSSHSKYERNYVKELQASQFSLQSREKDFRLRSNGDGIEEILRDHLSRCWEHFHKTYADMVSAVSAMGVGRSWLSAHCQTSYAVVASIEQRPRLSPIFFLQQLTRGRWQTVTSDWKHCIVQYALAVTEIQRAQRLVCLSGSHTDLIKELQNVGHTNWDPVEHPESLLLEVESGIIIRDVQEEIARQMRNPQPARNAVMQLNMGEGKSSVIVPIVAATLADASRLVRVIVAKPQSKQMFQMLISKLGGLLDRRIYHMPFSRSLILGEAEANAIGNICRSCMTTGGILLVQPEHILSFKLMGLECLITGKDVIGRCLLDTQHFFDTSSRDIVDESDENFSVKFELIYTMGMQRPVELSPERWTCIQQVLQLIRILAPEVGKEFPLSINITKRWAGSFLRTRVLGHDAQQRLSGCIARHLCSTGLHGFPIARQPEAVRQSVFRYITKLKLTADEIAQVESQGPEGFCAEATSKTLLLLRGLLAGGILAFAFGQKRWRVNYGLDANRLPQTKLAVPYRAKDSPSPRSEFSHPDVVIVLTSLSHYYGGLDDNNLFLTFEHLLRSDQADMEYQVWVTDAPDLPPAFHQLIGINLKDRFQCIEQVFPRLRYAKSVVDYFLAHIVFPKEMKEFPHKLSASGWDIGQTKTHPTTGFSGTNDSRSVLPLHVEQLDLQEQKHTNALVLEHLLRPENSVAFLPLHDRTSNSDAQMLLAMVTKMKPPAQVILDVGAQILELSNLGVAREWLKLVPDNDQPQAVVFFNDSDELSVLDRKGQVEPLQTSSFANQLDVCHFFLDEAHTRGTDLRLPEYYKAAVTLGANLTKDRLVQACMRMRKLGRGQSVVFCVPEEIKTKILTRRAKVDKADIDVCDVLSWAISETCTDMRRSMPLWAVQGQRFERQSTLWADACPDGNMGMSKVQAEKFLEDESQSIEDRYRPRTNTDITSSVTNSQNSNLQLIVQRCREFDTLDFNCATLQEEQERELSPEIVQERQVQKPAPAQPAEHHLHPDLTTFIATGKLVNCSQAYKPAFETLRNTSAAAHLDVSQFPRDLLVTADFARTVQVSSKSFRSDAYQRPVQWILTSIGSNTLGNDIVKHMIVISPYEAHMLQSDVTQSKTVTLHLYAPRPNLGICALDGLYLYAVPARPKRRILPRQLVLQLNLFAGQLYFGSFMEYVEVCTLLRLAWDKTGQGCVVAADGFIIRDDRSSGVSECGFRDSPITFLKVLMTKIRRNCEGIDKTHVGTILDGRLLHPSDFGEPKNLNT